MPNVETPILDNGMGPMFAGAFSYPKTAHDFELLRIGFDQTHIPVFTVAIHHSIGKNDRPFVADLPGRILEADDRRHRVRWALHQALRAGRASFGQHVCRAHGIGRADRIYRSGLGGPVLSGLVGRHSGQPGGGGGLEPAGTVRGVFASIHFCLFVIAVHWNGRTSSLDAGISTRRLLFYRR